MDIKKRAWAEISLENIEHNYNALRASVPAGTKFLGVVKANAYGHGAVAVASLLQEKGADYLAVACIDEAVELRENGITMPILILGYTPEEYTPELIKYDITQAVSSPESAQAFSAAALACGGKLKAHIKQDTGMSRTGFDVPGENIAAAADELVKACNLPGLDVEGIFTHFSVSDCEGDDNKAYTLAQYSIFSAVISTAEKRGNFKFRIRHCMNSGATVNYPGFYLDMFRPGILLYGYGDTSGRLGLRPGMTLKARIYAVKNYKAGTDISYGRTYTTERDTRMGVVSIGYADGLPRIISNKLSFICEGRPAPQRGRICMDMCMIDITDIPEAGVGSEVEIFGEHADLNLIADTAQTITYEVLCGVSPRVPRIYDK